MGAYYSLKDSRHGWGTITAPYSEWCRKSNDSAGNTGSSVSSGQGELMATKSKIILVGVAHHGPSNNSGLSIEHDLLVLAVVLGDAIFASFDIAQISDMSLLSIRATMVLVEWVVVWASSLASFDKVTCSEMNHC